MKEQSKHKTEARFGLSMPKTPITTFFDHVDGFKFFGFKFRVIFPYFMMGQLLGSR